MNTVLFNLMLFKQKIHSDVRRKEQEKYNMLNWILARFEEGRGGVVEMGASIFFISFSHRS